MRVCAKSRGVLRTFVGTSPRAASVALDGSEDIIGRAPARDETGKDAAYAADGTLAARSDAGF